MTSSGVQNLRAIFETGHNSLSPDRGRTGASSEAGTETSPRPLSKVRASFVAVDKNGHQSNQMTLRNVSNESSKLQSSSSSENCLTTETSVSTPSKIEKKLSQSSKSKASPKADKQSKANLNDTKVRNTNDKIVKSINKAPKEEENKIKSPMEKKTPDKAPKTTLRPSNQPNPPALHSPEQKISSNPSTPPRRHTQSIRSDIKANEGPKSSSLIGNVAKNSPKPVSKAETQESSPQLRIKKTHPKSSTKPVKLPPSLSNHTASSSSKTSKKTSSVLQPNLKQISGKNVPICRPQSRGSHISNINSAPKDLKTRSTVGQSPKGDSIRKPSIQNLASNDTSPVDNGFLARMMRPTTSSASKATERLISTSKEPKSNPKSSIGNRTRDERAKSETRKQTSITNKDKKEAYSRPKSQAAFNSKGLSRVGMKNPTKKSIPEELKDDTHPKTVAIIAEKSKEISDSTENLGDKSDQNESTVPGLDTNPSSENSNYEPEVNLTPETTKILEEAPIIVTSSLEVEREAIIESPLINDPVILETISLNQDKEGENAALKNLDCVAKGSIINHENSDKEVIDSASLDNETVSATLSSPKITTPAEIEFGIKSPEELIPIVRESEEHLVPHETGNHDPNGETTESIVSTSI